MKIAVLSLDNLRYDCAGYGEDRSALEDHGVGDLLRTPALERLAGESVCFTRCFATATYTTASHASMFTGRWPPHHGVRAFFDTRLGPVETLAERLRGAGYRTVFYSDAPVLFLPLGLERGFEHVLSGDESALFHLLGALREERVFLFCHLMDVHEPFLKCGHEYRPGADDDFRTLLKAFYEKHGLPSPAGGGEGNWRGLMERVFPDRPVDVLFPLYVRGISKFDQGRFPWFMERLDRSGFGKEEALLAVLSDHGEGRCFHDPGRWSFFGHGGGLFDEVLHVPLMIRHPGLAPRKEDRLASVADLGPTLLSFAGLGPWESACDGIDLFREERDAVYAEVWISTGEAAAMVEFWEAASGSRTGSHWPEFLLCQQAFRTVNRKYLRWNRSSMAELIEDEAFFALPAEAFVRGLYRRVFGRFEDPEGAAHYTSRIESGAVPREYLVAEFFSSPEYRSLEKRTPRFSSYRLDTDPGEARPKDASKARTAYTYFTRMAALHREALPAEKIVSAGVLEGRGADSAPGSAFSGDEEERERADLVARLKLLGYF